MSATFEEWWTVSAFGGHAGSEAYVRSVAKRAWEDGFEDGVTGVEPIVAELQARVRELEAALDNAASNFQSLKFAISRDYIKSTLITCAVDSMRQCWEPLGKWDESGPKQPTSNFEQPDNGGKAP